MTNEYEVALSFAGAQRAYVEDVANALQARGIKAFYDASDEEEIRLWGKDLAEEFHRIYSKASSVVVMFVSKEYLERSWTIHERRSAVERALRERGEYILPAKFDDVDLPGIPSTLAYLPLANVDAVSFAAKIEKKLVSLGARVPATGAPTSEWLVDGEKRIPGSISVVVNDSFGNPIAGVSVGVVRGNGTASFGETDVSGNVQIAMPGRELVDVWVAHPEYEPLLVALKDSVGEFRVRLVQLDGASGIIFQSSTGYLPGLKGRLAPIEDRGIYFYGDNISADGSPANPAHVVAGRAVALEDSLGKRMLVTFLSVVGSHSLIRYQSISKES